MRKLAFFAFLTSLLILFCNITNADSWGAWLPYWEQQSALAECSEQMHPYDTVIAFEAMLDSEGNLVMPTETREMLVSLQSMYRGSNTKVFLSIVNDVRLPNGTYSNKSTEILNLLLTDEARRASHIQDILHLAALWELDGIEIDYENMRKEPKLWGSYEIFLFELAEKLEQNSLLFRIALEPYSIREITIPETAICSVMCYNLFGYHSGPGPKADYDFLESLADLYSEISSHTSMAFATGGFLWKNNKVLQALSQVQAEQYLLDHNLSGIRDEDSGAMHAEWEEAADSYSIWYADGTTLRSWQSVMQEYGYTHFDLFRLSGNNSKDLSDHLFE